MFDQESYSFDATPAEPLTEGDLFYGYEVGRWSWSRRIYTIIGASALINLLAFTFVAQTNILTARGCDGPIIGRVCQVIDMAYVGTMLFGTEREMADVEYTRTQMGEAEEIVWIDQTGIGPQLEYPEGYFQLANPGQYDNSAMPPVSDSTAFPGFPTGNIPGITPTQPGKSLIDTPAYTPKKNKNAVVGEDVESPFADGDEGTTAKNGKGNTNNSGNNGKGNTDERKNETAKNTSGAEGPDEAKEDKFGVFINKRPMREKAQETIAEVEANRITLDRSFKVVLSGSIGLSDDKKTVVLKNPKPVKDPNSPPNDPAMEKLVQEWIIAVGDAGWFGYLDKFKAKNVLITVEQNETDLIASVKADQPSPEFANSQASGFRLLLQGAALAVKDDEKAFLERANVTSEGKAFILNFSIPKPIVQEMIKRKLDEAAAGNKNTINSNFRPDQNTAAKE